MRQKYYIKATKAVSGYRVDIVCWVGLNLVDALLITILLGHGFIEANPIIARFVENTGSLIGYKMALTLGVLIPLARFNKLHLLKWLNIGMGAIVIWNVVWLMLV